MKVFISPEPSEAMMQEWTLRACFVACFLSCLVLAVSLLALVGNRALRYELNEMATRLAALEARPAQPAQPPPRREQQ